MTKQPTKSNQKKLIKSLPEIIDVSSREITSGPSSPQNVCKPKRKYCSSKPRKGTVITCPVCGKQVFKPAAWIRKVKLPTCSHRCNGVLRGKEWAKHAYKAHAAWTEESKRSAREKMTGANNPAWKGGVTYWRKHGNYPPIKYVRCPKSFLAMARKDGYIMEHRLIVAQYIGRCLERSEVVHHIDHNPLNNNLSNLMLFSSNTAHKKYEATGQPLPLWQL